MRPRADIPSLLGLTVHVVPRFLSTHYPQVTVKSSYVQRLRETAGEDVVRHDQTLFDSAVLPADAESALQRYFARHDLFGDLNFGKMKERDIGKLGAACEELPGEKRRALKSQLREIFDLASQQGTLAILDEAKWRAGNLKADPALAPTQPTVCRQVFPPDNPMPCKARDGVTAVSWPCSRELSRARTSAQVRSARQPAAETLERAATGCGLLAFLRPSPPACVRCRLKR
jgi:hypothetical protein